MHFYIEWTPATYSTVPTHCTWQITIRVRATLLNFLSVSWYGKMTLTLDIFSISSSPLHNFRGCWRTKFCFFFKGFFLSLKAFQWIFWWNRSSTLNFIHVRLVSTAFNPIQGILYHLSKIYLVQTDQKNEKLHSKV